LFVLDLANVRAAEADARNFFSRTTELAQGNFTLTCGRPHTRIRRAEDAGCVCRFHKLRLFMPEMWSPANLTAS
jgi:hypothetical protein